MFKADVYTRPSVLKELATLLAIYNKVNDNSPFGFLISFHRYADRRQATHDS